ncbi:MAG TPA: CoB--CoM heterodisulfide reductase iron-sulfur subunit B family protein, partial [Verrucomicrobiae bacterium]|nr:CoB--CoM heterodisulfide reductase iron-sulfur subunit B family protein [Verrucomicrobiae bacterium]
MKYSYFPGCSLKGLGRAYEESLLPVMRELGVELLELEDWNCCGATAYMSVEEQEACVLAARNLAIAEKNGCYDLLTPCSACYLVLNKTKHNIEDFPQIRDGVHRALQTVNLSYHGKTAVRHPLDVLFHDVGVEAIKRKVVRPLKGLKVAPYYGCQVVRPYATFDEAWNPTTMDQILAALGAEIVHFPLKTKCCGA